MKPAIAASIAIIISLNSMQVSAESGEGCPRTVGSDHLLGAPFPDSGIWYGSEALAVMLPADGTWGATRAGALIAVKLFWWSSAYQLGMEPDLKVQIKDLFGGPENARVTRTTNALLDPIPAMLVGVDIPGPGCWEITGEFLGQSLTFVVETPPDVAEDAAANQ